MKTLDDDSELIITGPLQIKPRLSIGNIYDLTIADFYSKARKFTGTKTTTPLFLNVNGDPLIKQIEKCGQEITSVNIQNFINDSIRTIKLNLSEHYLDFDFWVRDDLVEEEMKNLTHEKYKTTFLVGEAVVNECPSCGNIYGSDPTISICKACGNKTIAHTRKTLYKKILKSDVKSKINSIRFSPPSIKTKLEDFVERLPDEYDLILEKNRVYTIKYGGFKLDPRFVAIMLPAIIHSSIYKNKTWVHGDVVKKFDYYGLCYLNSEDCPTRIVSHGLIQGTDNKKLRWQDANSFSFTDMDNVDSRILRAHLLNFDVLMDRMFNPLEIQQNTKPLIKLYTKMGRAMETQNIDQNKQSIRPELYEQMQLFNESVGRFKFNKAFVAMNSYANACWKLILRGDKISSKESDTIRALRIMFFGE